jgi:hypothetical protein
VLKCRNAYSPVPSDCKYDSGSDATTASEKVAVGTQTGEDVVEIVVVIVVVMSSVVVNVERMVSIVPFVWVVALVVVVVKQNVLVVSAVQVATGAVTVLVVDSGGAIMV